MESLSDTTDLPGRRSAWFIAGYGLAQAGAFLAFIPLLMLLLPDQAVRIVGDAAAPALVSQAAMIGGAVATVANLVFGALSDRTTGRWGRRRPWILGGAIGVAACLMAFPLTREPWQLLAMVVLVQVAVNMLYAPLNALVPDMTPDRQKGLVSAWAGAALPVANLFTAVIAARLMSAPALAYGVVAAAVVLALGVFAIGLREPPATTARSGFSLSFAALGQPRFRRAFTARLLVEGAVAVNTLYLLLWLRAAPVEALPSGVGPAATFGLLLAGSTGAAAAAGMAGGWMSDRLGGRRGFVIAAAVGMGLALALMLVLPAWPGVMIAQLLFGAAHGVHASTVAAMTAEILPDRGRAGRDLGLMNIAVAAPQSLAPAGALALLGAGLSLSSVFAAAAMLALGGAAVLATRVRVVAGAAR